MIGLILRVSSETELIMSFTGVIVIVDLKIRPSLWQETSIVVYKIKTLAKLRNPQNCVQMLLFCIITNLVMGVAKITRFNVQTILIIALTQIPSLASRLRVMASSDVKNIALSALKSSHIMTTQTSFLVIVLLVHVVIAGKGMGPNSTTSNAPPHL